MEHQRERQLIEQQHKEAQEAAARMRAEIDAMQPTSDWYGTPPAVALDPTWQVRSALAACNQYPCYFLILIAARGG